MLFQLYNIKMIQVFYVLIIYPFRWDRVYLCLNLDKNLKNNQIFSVEQVQVVRFCNIMKW